MQAVQDEFTEFLSQHQTITDGSRKAVGSSQWLFTSEGDYDRDSSS
jgi:hypothetical protein